MKELEFHPLAEGYPLMEGKAFDDLCTDIRENDLDKPITKYEGKILDGRNRYRACLAVKVRPKFKEYEGDDPKGFVETQNDHRRHESAEMQQRRREERVARVAEKRREGKSLRAIGDEEGVSPVQVMKDLQAATVNGLTVEPESGKIEGKDGKKRTAKPKKAAENSSSTVNPCTVEDGELEREPGCDDPETPELFDQAEQPLPPQAYDAFNQLPELRNLCSELDKIAREIERIGKLPVGRRSHWQSAQSQVKAARKTLYGGRPAYVCPYCRGTKSDCRACEGQGWVTASTYDQAPPEMKEIRRKDKGGAA